MTTTYVPGTAAGGVAGTSKGALLTAAPIPTITLKTPSARDSREVTIPVLGHGFWKVTGDECYESALSALRLGFRHLDTAAAYDNEEEVGRAIRDSGIPREQIFLTTKLAQEKMTGFDAVLEEFDKSLVRLGVDYVDLYLVHFPGPKKRSALMQLFTSKPDLDNATLRVETWRAMESLHASGRARAIGVSNFEIKHLEEIMAVATVPPAVNQIELHPKLTQRALSTYCRDSGVVVEAFSSLGDGHLVDEDQRVLRVMSERYGKTIPQILLRWNLQHGNVVLMRTTDVEHRLENLNLWDFELTPEEMRVIDGLNEDKHLVTEPEEID